MEAFVSISPADIQEHYKIISTVFAGNSKTIQNEIVDCISQYIDEYVKNEIDECKFFSVQVDDSTDIAQKSQCSIILRYVNSTEKLVERSLGFFDVSSSRSAEALFNLVSNCLQRFEYKSKLIGQCFDGASAMAGHLNGLQAKIKGVAPQAVFVHCLAHRLSLVLQQSCNSISKCRIFFATISGLSSFFHNSAKRTQVSDPIVGRRIPTFAVKSWTSNSKILKMIHSQWDSLKQVFQEIMKDPSSDQTSVRQSDGFLHKFDNFEFALFMIIFNDIFGHTEILFDYYKRNHSTLAFVLFRLKIPTNYYATNEMKKFSENFTIWLLQEQLFLLKIVTDKND